MKRTAPIIVRLALTLTFALGALGATAATSHAEAGRVADARATVSAIASLDLPSEMMALPRALAADIERVVAQIERGDDIIVLGTFRLDAPTTPVVPTRAR